MGLCRRLLNVFGLRARAKADGVSNLQPGYCLETLQDLRTNIPRPDQSAEFGVFFQQISEAVQIDHRVSRAPSGQVLRTAPTVELPAQCSEAVHDILLQFFEQNGWRSPADMRQAWDDAVPYALKKLVFTFDPKQVEDGVHATPATIFKNAYHALQAAWTAEPAYSDAVPA